jgi:NAD(P)-dependent dehydrogenase (short-subunit alcohol dehydrogenase family)
MRGLPGKRIIVVGGASGIGAATATRLAEEGAKVLIGDINPQTLAATVAKITAAGGTAKGVRFDLGDSASAENLVRACIESYGGVDGLANIGALLQDESLARDLDLLETPEAYLHKQLDYNFIGYTRTVRAVLPHLVAQKNGAIVNTSSGNAFSGEPTRLTYSAAKCAVHALTRHVARRWGADNIRCNAIAPGLTLSEAVRANMSNSAHHKGRVAATPLGRAGEPDELAAVYAFLLSDDAAWITGQVWSVNGGRLTRE